LSCQQHGRIAGLLEVVSACRPNAADAATARRYVDIRQ
jgi:hypothetical protein